MSSTPKTATRRSTRSAAAAASSPVKEAMSTPVASHPIKGGTESEGPSPREPKEAKQNGKARGKKASGSAADRGSGGSGTSPALLVLALLVVAGGVAYTRFVQPQLGGSWRGGSGGAKLSNATAPKKQTGVLVKHSQPLLPPVEFTREEAAVFEKACEDHYGLPPTPPELVGSPTAQEDVAEGRALAEEAGADVVADSVVDGEGGQEAAAEADPERDTGAHAEDSFDPEIHRQYLELPAWPEPTEDELTGSWQLTQDIYDYGASLPMAQVLSNDFPRLMTFPSFLTPEEVNHMIKVSRDNLERSEVLVAEGEESVNDIRTSFGFWPELDDVSRRIIERIHRTIGIPEKFGEGLYVLNYQNGQKYEAHNDQCMDGPQGTGNKADAACLDFLKRAGGPKCGPGHGGPTCGDRVATFILYLKSPDRGGVTAFPDSQLTKEAMGAEHRPGNSPDTWYCDDPRVLSAAPAAGTAVFFWDYRPGNGTGTGSYEDGSASSAAQTVYEAMHSGCPVWEGEKYISTRWIRSAGFDYPRPHFQEPAATEGDAAAAAE